MDSHGLLEKHAETEFQPVGKDETGAYMILEDYVIHVRSADVLFTEGLALKDVWPFVDKIQTL